jgi:hypothetical protein
MSVRQLAQQASIQAMGDPLVMTKRPSAAGGTSTSLPNRDDTWAYKMLAHRDFDEVKPHPI